MSTSHLIDVLRQTLMQERDLLSQLNDVQYTAPGTGAYKSSIGMHIRHNLDHFSAFFDGIESGRIDYESRQRNHMIEESAEFAIGVINDFIYRLTNSPIDAAAKVSVREEDGTKIEQSTWLESSYGREFQFLLGHTVHHHAIIAIMLAEKELPLSVGFGVAPSTQRHEQSCNR